MNTQQYSAQPSRKRGLGFWLSSLVTIAALHSHAIAQTRLYVNETAPGGNGQSWAAAFRHPESAIAQAVALGTVSEIWIARGSYRPVRRTDPNDPRSVAFRVPGGVAFIGGFAGHESTLLERDIAANPTVLSGDINGDDQPGFVGYEENARRVVVSDSPQSPLVIDGFIIEHGFSADPTVFVSEGAGVWSIDGGLDMVNCVVRENLGTGVYVSSSDPTIIEDSFFLENWANGAAGAFVRSNPSIVRGCRFESNRSEDDGGGLAIISDRADVLIESCEFVDNVAKHRGGGLNLSLPGQTGWTATLSSCQFIDNQASDGGGAYIRGPGVAVLIDCGFIQNKAQYSSRFGGGVGGGMYANNLDEIRVITSLFHDNVAFFDGGGLYENSCDQLDVVSSVFIGNSAPGGDGGGIGLEGSAITNIVQCLFAGNFAGELGGATLLPGNRPGLLTGCTFYANSAGAFGGGVFSYSQSNSISNSVFWNNTDGLSRTAEFAQIWGVMDPVNCCIEGWSGVMGGAGNIGEDPQFRDPLGPDGVPGTIDDDLRLGAGSVCIDAGDNNSVPPDTFDLDGDGNTTEPLPIDLDGNERFIDDPASPNTGTGTPPIIDMGPYEYQDVICYADCDPSTGLGVLDIFDFLCFQDRFVSGALYACDCDTSTGLGICDVFDFLCFQDAFVLGCP